ncbi:GGDEF domain-containing protein [Sulfitobacter sp. TSTF-M16]|uniref:GGDEF domain-containing protein n=2 Tax=Sulfitobacter aestuariivivens TaxID=2766981 RepID=A0A927D1T2_9RHOB|nr:GGDEF domain-containing protein [Sulfitobacter aestuariivivens]
MHLLVGPTGHITHAGPTIAKLRAEQSLIGQRFLEVFAINRPRAVASMQDLAANVRKKLHLELRDARRTSLKGIMVPLPEDPDSMILNLSFGISIVDAVRDYSLTNADFAATDLAIEMLYLVEAKTAAMAASRRLNMSLQGAKIAAEEQAFTDTLTGLKNRRAMDTVLARMIAGGGSFAVMHIDLDYFKAVNDTLGHAAGDHVLQEVARIMVDETRESDTVARVGGDEFTVILPNIAGYQTLQRVGERIIERLEVPVPFQGQECRISASIGTVWIRAGTPAQAEEVLADADVALYASKRAGRAQQTFYAPELRRAANAEGPPAGRDSRAG